MMTPKYSGACKFMAALLVVAMAQVFVLAGPAGRALYGRLATSGNGVVAVNSVKAGPGTTILSGTQIQTPENVAATVRLDSLGSLELSPNTNLTLSFSEGRVDVNVASGSAWLTAYKGVNGSITFGDKTERTDPSKDVSVASSGAPVPQGGPMSNNWSRREWAWFTVASVTATIIIIALVKRGDDPSPAQP
jgi:hypothetical protein